MYTTFSFNKNTSTRKLLCILQKLRSMRYSGHRYSVKPWKQGMTHRDVYQYFTGMTNDVERLILEKNLGKHLIVIGWCRFELK